MTAPNAALFYASDGYRPADKGINGRRVAGESFLKGFLRHADVDEFVILAKSTPEAEEVATLARTLRPHIPLRAVGLIRPGKIAPLTALYYPAATLPPRRGAGQTAGLPPGPYPASPIPHRPWASCRACSICAWGR